jgi:hypothetical protein
VASPWAHPLESRSPHSWPRIAIGAVCLLSALVVFVIVAGWLAQLIFAQQTASVASQLADRIAQNIDRGIVNFDNTLQTVIGGAQSPASPELNPQQRNVLLAERTPKDPQIMFLDVLDAGGNVLANLAQKPDTTNWATRKYFTTLRDNPTSGLYMDVFGREGESTLGLILSRRITRPDGSFAGVVVTGVRLTYLHELLSQYALNANETITLLREDGLVVVRHPFEGPGIGQMIDRTSPFFTFMQSGRTPIIVRDENDITRRYVFHQVGDLPLYVAISSPTNSFHLTPLWWWAVPASLRLGLWGAGTARSGRQRLRVPE